MIMYPAIADAARALLLDNVGHVEEKDVSSLISSLATDLNECHGRVADYIQETENWLSYLPGHWSDIDGALFTVCGGEDISDNGKILFTNETGMVIEVPLHANVVLTSMFENIGNL